MKIKLPDTIYELGIIKCKEPIYIDLYFVDRKNKIAHFEWDFGMDCKVFLDSWMLESRAPKGIKNKILMQIQYDLGHTFFHYEGDPNYTYYHWALKAWLKDRVDLDENFGQDSYYK
jgi:hypothetical protein